MGTEDLVISDINKVIQRLYVVKDIALRCNCSNELIELLDLISEHYCNLNHIISIITVPRNYLKQFHDDSQELTVHLPFKENMNSNFVKDENKEEIKLLIEAKLGSFQEHYKRLKFNYYFFDKLGFLQNHVVAIGANGSGKTSLAKNLKRYLPQNGVVISAQKVLIIPTFGSISNFNNTSRILQKNQTSPKDSKVTYSTSSNTEVYSILKELGGEFQILLDNLLAERNVIRNKFWDDVTLGKKDIDIPLPKLDIAFNIWNKLFKHRKLECNDGINVMVSVKDNSYPAYQMSDGEKVTLYLIAQVLQGPKSGFIIVDEPEMYLHKTIITQLWNTLELERPDCIFIYLTHDLDFATSRINANKVWIKSFEHPDKWDIENIPVNELPEALIMELLGSRKSILFCEGKKGGIDENIYNILFPQFKVTPVETCFSVINFTKAFNKIPNINIKAYGLIDSDYHEPDRLKLLEKNSVFSHSISEIENLFLDRDFLLFMSKILLKDNVVENIIDETFISLKNEIELQSSNYVSAKINNYFKDSHISRGNNLTLIETNFKKFQNEVKIKEWYTLREGELNDIVLNRDYPKLLKVYNNKGLKTIVNKHLKISDFVERSLTVLKREKSTHEFLLKYFPILLRNVE